MWFQDEEWVGRVRGALMVSFHTYKAYRDQMAEDGVTFDDPVRKPIALLLAFCLKVVLNLASLFACAFVPVWS